MLLSFATEIPLDRSRRPGEFIDVVRSWILASPHTQLVASDLANIPAAGEWSIQKGDDLVQALLVSTGSDDWASFRWTKFDGAVAWETAIVYSRQAVDTWVGIRISRESNQPARRLSEAKKPIIVRQLLQSLGEALDGELPVLDVPHGMANDQVALATRLISGTAGCRLPVVYMSCGFDGDYIADANSLANDLSGMAHVIVEPNRIFSRQLQVAVNSANVYGGTIGVYWPDGAGRRSFFLGREYESPLDIKRAIVDEIRNALLNRRPLPRCTWPAVQEAASMETYAALKASGSLEIDKYVEAFDSDIKAKEQKLADAEEEISRLKGEIKKLEAQAAVGTVTLRTGPERDLYDGEMGEIVRDALKDAVERVVNDSRREHVLKAILKVTGASEVAPRRRDDLKQLLRGYRNMDGRIRRGLESLGFAVEDDGRHYKLIYQGDDRYTFSLPKTGGDFRGGLNAARDIAKRVF